MQVTGPSLHSLASDLGSPGPSFLSFKMGRMLHTLNGVCEP